VKLIQTITLGSANATIEFISIPQTFTDLAVFISGRGTASAIDEILYMNINDVNTDRTERRLTGTGSTVASSSFGGAVIGNVPAATSTSNTFGNVVVYLPNYAGSAAKSFSVDIVTENNATAAQQRLFACLWNNTASINQLQFGVNSTLLAGSTISLYGILKGSDGIVTTS
jgi:hypothetical protein